MGVERAVIPVDDLGAAIERFEAEGYRLVTISPADAPRIADLDGPDRLVRLDATATAPSRLPAATPSPNDGNQP